MDSCKDRLASPESAQWAGKLGRIKVAGQVQGHLLQGSLLLRGKESESVSRSVMSMDCSPPGFSVCGVSQARILEWVAIPFSRGSSPPRDRARISHTAGRLVTIPATREAQARSVLIPTRLSGWDKARPHKAICFSPLVWMLISF